MLTFIKDLSNKLLEFIKDDPVRPEIPTDFRVSNGRMVAALVNEEKPDAMVCVSFHDFIPENVNDLSNTTQLPTTAVFYTIWSYQAGAGRKLIEAAQSHIKQALPKVTTYITLSPKTELARRFHSCNPLIFQE